MSPLKLHRNKRPEYRCGDSKRSWLERIRAAAPSLQIRPRIKFLLRCSKKTENQLNAGSNLPAANNLIWSFNRALRIVSILVSLMMVVGAGTANSQEPIALVLGEGGSVYPVI